MTLFQAVLLSAAFLCSLVAGLLFAFAAVVMPGIKRLDNGDFIRSFQVMDRVIQNNQPLFVVVWVCSVFALLMAAVLGLWELSGANRLLLAITALIYLIGVQLPTITINIPLNNALQKLDVGRMDDTTRKRARDGFEPRWNRWNVMRAVGASLTSVLLVLLLLRV